MLAVFETQHSCRKMNVRYLGNMVEDSSEGGAPLPTAGATATCCVAAGFLALRKGLQGGTVIHINQSKITWLKWLTSFLVTEDAPRLEVRMLLWAEQAPRVWLLR